MQLVVLMKVLEKRIRRTSTRYAVALVLDSAPDDSVMRILQIVFTSNMRNPVMKSAVTPLLVFPYLLFRLRYGTNLMSELRQRLLTS